MNKNLRKGLLTTALLATSIGIGIYTQMPGGYNYGLRTAAHLLGALTVPGIATGIGSLLTYNNWQDGVKEFKEYRDSKLSHEELKAQEVEQEKNNNRSRKITTALGVALSIGYLAMTSGSEILQIGDGGPIQLAQYIADFGGVLGGAMLTGGLNFRPLLDKINNTPSNAKKLIDKFNKKRGVEPELATQSQNKDEKSLNDIRIDGDKDATFKFYEEQREFNTQLKKGVTTNGKIEMDSGKVVEQNQYIDDELDL